MSTTKPMTMRDAAAYLRDNHGFSTLAAAASFLREVRDTGHGDRETWSVGYTTAGGGRRFIFLEDGPSVTVVPATIPAAPPKPRSIRHYAHFTPPAPNARQRRAMRNGWTPAA
jgi:hypothetical protein